MTTIRAHEPVEWWTLIPGDRVTFDGHEWRVFMTVRGEQHDLSPIVITRPEHPGRACAVIDLTRPRCELRLIPRSQP
jgi:hypothetical protein